MAYLGSWKIDDYITFYVNTHTAATGAATDADAVPSYRVYEDETGAAITNGNMALLDNANTVGFYSERLQLLAATGFEKGKQYCVYISATVATIEGTIHHTWQIEAEVDANTVSASNVSANVEQLGGVTQSATDLKDFADAGYDPATNKVQGVVLVDTTTTNTDMRGTDNAALAATALTDATWTDARAGYLDNLNIGENVAGTSEIAALPTAAENVNEWETQSQADPTGFHVNVLEVAGTAQTANDNGADINAILLDTGTDGVLLAATATSAQLVDDVWDEVLTAATHNVASSSGRRLRQIGSLALVDGTLATGGAAGTSTCVLNGNAAATARLYEQNLIVIVGGPGVGQTRMIVQYLADRTATIERPWDVTVDNTSEYQIQANSGLIISQNGVAQAGTASTIQLATSAIATANTYRYSLVHIGAGTGLGQTRLITAYAADRTCTIAPDWDVTPDATSAYKILPVGLAVVESFTTAALASINAEVVDTLATDTYAQPGQEAPAATQTLAKMVAYLYKVFRNKLEQTATTLSVYNDAGAVVDQKATVSDDGTTFTRGEIGTGP